MRRIGHRMLAIHCLVEHKPGQTAHYLAPYLYGARRPMWGRVYAAFDRAYAAGLIRAERVGTITRYYPTQPVTGDDPYTQASYCGE